MSKSNGIIYCNSKADIPTGEHYAVVEFSTVYHEGDERSRTCPGHGYPAYSEPVAAYIAFETKEAWEEYITKKMKNASSYGSDKNFVAFKSTPATIGTEIKISL